MEGAKASPPCSSSYLRLLPEVYAVACARRGITGWLSPVCPSVCRSLDLISRLRGKSGAGCAVALRRTAPHPLCFLPRASAVAGVSNGNLGCHARPSRFQTSLASALDRSVTTECKQDADKQMCQILQKSGRRAEGANVCEMFKANIQACPARFKWKGRTRLWGCSPRAMRA